MMTVGYLPPVSGITMAGQLAVGVVMMDVSQDYIDAVYTSSLNDLDYVSTVHTHETGYAFSVQLAGGIVVPVTETLSARLWGGATWMSETDFTAVVRQASGETRVEGLQLGGIGYLVRVGLSASL